MTRICKKNAEESSSTLKSNQHNSEMFAISQENLRWQDSGRGNRGRQRSSPAQGSTQRRSSVDGGHQQGNQNTTCLCCGRPNHLRTDCRFKDYTCNFCHVKGHLERDCRRKSVDVQRNREQVKKITTLEEEFNTKAAGPSNFNDFFCIKTGMEECVSAKHNLCENGNVRSDFVIATVEIVSQCL